MYHDLTAVTRAVSKQYPAFLITATRHNVWSLEVTLVNSSLAAAADSVRRVTAHNIAHLAYSVHGDSAELREIAVTFQSRVTSGAVTFTTEQARYVFYSSDFRSPVSTDPVH
jgi:hypothetical protein